MNPDTIAMEEPLMRVGEGHEIYEPAYSYDEVFPALPKSSNISIHPTGVEQANERMKVSSSIITQVSCVVF